jgi:hypothetical protein
LCLCIPEFAKVCERSTDFHFPNLEKQFTKIEEELKTAWETRRKVAEDNDKVSLKSTGSASSGDTQVYHVIHTD